MRLIRSHTICRPKCLWAVGALVWVLLLGGAPPRADAVEIEVIAQSLSAPFLVTTPTGDPRLFIAEQRGVIKVYKNGMVQPT